MNLNKKGNQMMAWGLLFIMLVLVGIAYVHVWAETSSLKKTTGQLQGEILRSYDKGEKALIYTDQAAKASIYSALNTLGRKGGYSQEPVCLHHLDPSGEYIYWAEIVKNPVTNKDENKECYPTESTIRKSFSSFFNKEFNDFADIYPNLIIPKNNYDLSFNKQSNLEIIGIATRKIKVPRDKEEYKARYLSTLYQSTQDCITQGGYVRYDRGYDLGCKECPEEPRCGIYGNEIECNIDSCSFGCEWQDRKCTKIVGVQYAVKPSFRLEIQYNFIDKFNKHIEKAKDIKSYIETCLKEGSNQIDDEDLDACTTKAKQDIQDVDHYQIETLPEDLRYMLLFDIEDPTFYSPYSEKLLIKYGIRFMDTFPPPVTPANLDQRTDGNYIVWEKNKASDVTRYTIYAKEILKEPDGTIITQVPTQVDPNDQIATETNTEYKIGLQGDYYIYVAAHDDANLIAQDIQPIQITI